MEPDLAGTDEEPAARNLAVGEVARRATIIKCMGRTYTATARDGTIHLHDRTDITRPRALGTARSAYGCWEIHDPRGNRLTRTDDLLDALALLRQHHWPPLDQTSRLPVRAPVDRTAH